MACALLPTVRASFEPPLVPLLTPIVYCAFAASPVDARRETPICSAL